MNDLKFLNETMNPNEIEVFADYLAQDNDRCINSALAHVQGLYPTGSGYRIPNGLDQDLLDPPFETLQSSLN